MINNTNDDIDLVEILGFLKRNFLKFFSFTIFFLIIFSFNFLNEKKQYKGVLTLNQKKIENLFPTLLLKRYEDYEDKLTQEEILRKNTELLFKSTSKLENVFNYYKKVNPIIINGPEIDINSWKKKVNIKFFDNTTILSIEFKDGNKDKITPVLYKVRDELEIYFKEIIKNDLTNAALKFRYWLTGKEKSEEIQQNALIELDELFKKSNFDSENSKFPKIFEVVSIEVLEEKKNSNEEIKFILKFYVISIIIFTLILLLIENKVGLIYELSTLKKNINCKFIGKISSKEKKLTKFQLKKSISGYDKNNYGVIPLDSPFTLKNSQISQVLVDIDSNLNLLDLSNFNSIEKYENIYFIGQANKCSFKNIEIANKLISIYDKKIIGWFFIQN